eukprot:TRINITY_DN110609_c0_g1_i1.p1 TRINITY_DN110609_c0_g1~~TRINITY_DN110609_c0_g1_i1.p1  ORF type:complete len:1040 (+),score=248.14 TRINITY_DN110609_c0_g1_i1:41-3160(+)
MAGMTDDQGQLACVGQSVGYWLGLKDFVASDERNLQKADLQELGFPRDWPAIYTQSAALKALIGKRGRLASKRVAVAGKPLPEHAVPSLKFRPLQSFSNAEQAARAVPGLSVVRGWAVYERLDLPVGTAFVAEEYWWNALPDGGWVDHTPHPEAVDQILLVDPVTPSSPRTQGVLTADQASLCTLLLAKRFPSLAASAAKVKPPTPVASQQAKPQKAIPSEQAKPQKAASPLDYSKWSSIVDSDDEEVQTAAVAGKPAIGQDCGVKDLADEHPRKPLPVPDFLAGNTGGGGGTNCYLSILKLLDEELEKGDSENAHQLSQAFGKMFHNAVMDKPRQLFYKSSLAAIPDDAFVVVAGLGSIIPMLTAARRGAAKGVLLETSVKLSQVAEAFLKSNQIDFPVAVLKGTFDQEGVAKDVLRRLVPKDAKNVVILTERMAHDLLSSGIVPGCVALHKAVRAVAPSAKVSHIPRTVELFGTPVEIRSERLKEFDIRPFNAFRHTSSNDKADFWWWPVRLDNQHNTRVAVLGPSNTLCGFDFDRSPEITMDEVRRSLTVKVNTRGRCNAIALWWSAKFGDQEYSTRPQIADPSSNQGGGQQLHRSEWKQAVHYLAGETNLFPGDSLELLMSITPRFTLRMMQQSPFSVEAPSWVQAPTHSKFSATMPILPYHFLMLTDMERIEVYGRAIRAAVQQLQKKLGRRPRVLDAGCGLGLLGMTAALEGAEVWLCEAVPQMRRMCREVVAANAAAVTEKRGLVQLLPPMMSTRIQIGEDVKEKFDMVVSEVMDLWCLGEGVIPTMWHAYRKLVTDGGLLLPGRLMFFVQPLEMFLWGESEKDHKCNFSSLGREMKSKFSPMRINQLPHRWLSEEAIPALEIDLRNVPPQPSDKEPNLDGDVKLCIRMGGKPALRAKISSAKIDHSGMLCGYGIWWAADLGNGNVVTNAPSNPQRSWKQIVRWLDQPRFVAEGEEVQVLTCYNEHQVNVEDLHISQELVAEYQEHLQASEKQQSPMGSGYPASTSGEQAQAALTATLQKARQQDDDAVEVD